MARLSDRRKSVEQIVFCTVALAVFVLAWIATRDYPDIVQWFPTGVLLAAMVLLGVKIAMESVRLVRMDRTDGAATDR